jgi:hypothetical protein
MHDRPDPLTELLQRWSNAMLAADVTAVMACCHPDIRLAMNFAEVPLPFIGVSHGADAARQRTELMFRTWRFKDSHVEIISRAPDFVRTRTTVQIVHKWTGFTFDAMFRQEIWFENGLIRSFDSYMDAPRFNAFLRFVGIAPGRKPRTPTDLV